MNRWTGRARSGAARFVRQRGQRTRSASATDAPEPGEDLDQDDARILDEVRALTMTSRARQLALLDAVGHVVVNEIPGAIVECGVWRGGLAIAAARKLQVMGAEPRELWLYDTFEGMTAPGSEDTTAFGEPATVEWERARRSGRRPWGDLFEPDDVSAETVRARVLASGHPAKDLRLVQGPVEQTLPGERPPSIAVLRIDTDWYASTAAELEHLYPRLTPGGVLLIDDYGHWRGSRRAVDEYFADPDVPRPLLVRVDYTGRVAVKP